MENSLPSIPSQVKLSYNGNDFLLDIAEGNMISLNAIYEIAGSPENQDPRQWKRLPQSKQFIDLLVRKLNVDKSDVVKTNRGKGGGTWAHWQLAMAYAMYLGNTETQLKLFQSVKDLGVIIESLRNFAIDPDIFPACKLYVYAIREINTGNIKLGLSKDPTARLKQLQTGNSSRLELVAYCLAKHGFDDECASHKDNANYHIHGEWFTSEAKLTNMQ